MMEDSPKRRDGGAGPSGSAIVLGLFLLALAVRLIYLWQVRSNPFFDMPVGDAGWHDAWARTLIGQNWEYSGVFFRAPLYPYTLAAAYALLGEGAFMVRAVQAVLGSLTCLLVYRLAGRVFDRTTALVAGATAAFYGPMIFFDAELLIVVLILFLDLLLLCLFIGRRRRPGWIGTLLAGLVLGLSIIARPNVVLFVPALFLWIWWSGGPDRSRFYRQTILIGLMIVLVILPVALHNLRAGDGRVLISSQAGINFYIGNEHRADGKTAAPPGGVTYEDSRKDNVWAASERIAQQEKGRQLKPSEVSAYWFARAFEEIGRAPLRWAGLMIRKVYFLINGHEIESNVSIYTYREWSPLLRLLVWKGPISFPFGLLLPLALAGLWLSRRDWRKHLLIYLFLATYALSVVLFFVNARFRMPLVPLLIIYAAWAAVWLIRQVHARRWTALALPTVILALALLTANSRLFAVDEINLAREQYSLAVAYERKGMPQEAMEHYQRCLSIDPYTVQASYNLAKIYRQLGYLDAAVLEFRRTLTLKPDFSEGYNGLGITYARQGQYDQAIEQLRRALDLDPAHGWAHLNLANVYLEVGQADSALARYRLAARLLPQVGYIQDQIARLEARGGG
jgi:4-amino-4-deoxy-L-arabinose transferase-like glycosyltransferase